MVHWASIVPRDATGEVLGHPHFRYSLVLAALLRENKFYKMVRQLPLDFDEERMILRMPPKYGFMTSRYVVMKIEMCHQVINIPHPYYSTGRRRIDKRLSYSFIPRSAQRGLLDKNIFRID